MMVRVASCVVEYELLDEPNICRQLTYTLEVIVESWSAVNELGVADVSSSHVRVEASQYEYNMQMVCF